MVHISYFPSLELLTLTKNPLILPLILSSCPHVQNWALRPRRLQRCHSAAGSKGHPCDRSSILRSIVRFIGTYLSKLNSEINKTQCIGPRHFGGKGAHYAESPGENSGHSPSSHPSVTFNLIPWSMRNHNPYATDTFLFSLHEIHLVPSVFSVFSLEPTRTSNFVQVSFNGT